VPLEPANCSKTATAEEITLIATVHDSLGRLPAQAERFRRIIREQFVRMYEENEVLAQALNEARMDLKDPKELPDKPPERGSTRLPNGKPPVRGISGPRGAGSIFITIFDRQHRDCGFEGRNIGPDFLRQKSQPFAPFGCETGISSSPR
jgi:hypothetical protein